MRKINISNETKRDAEVAFGTSFRRVAPIYKTASGSTGKNERRLKATMATTEAALLATYGEGLADALIAGDPEIDMERLGLKLEGLKKVFITQAQKVAYGVSLNEHAQLSDLEKSQRELMQIIGRLEGEMKTAFVDAFNKINENFAVTFSELFGGGSAEISLSDPENVLESGIEIKAAPPGKIIKNLMQLSGGEQAFIGVALFFAILKVNPTPFCILDEIEAALDEVNVERLAQYIKRYSDETQFIMITHRRGTMAAATRLYGVTMPERGISKVLTLDVADIAKNKENDWNGLFS